jgi:hypothetical protein
VRKAGTTVEELVRMWSRYSAEVDSSLRPATADESEEIFTEALRSSRPATALTSEDHTGFDHPGQSFCRRGGLAPRLLFTILDGNHVPTDRDFFSSPASAFLQSTGILVFTDAELLTRIRP